MLITVSPLPREKCVILRYLLNMQKGFQLRFKHLKLDVPFYYYTNGSTLSGINQILNSIEDFLNSIEDIVLLYFVPFSLT